MAQIIEKTDYPYGDHFTSYEELNAAIKLRQRQKISDLRGSAVVWKDEKPYPKRIGVLILSDGELCFSHAENI